MDTPAQNDEGGERMSAREAERSEWSRQSDAGGDKGRIDDVLKKIERTRQARRHKFYLRDEKITLSHGSGGKATHNLIEGVFAPAFSNPLLDPMDDAAIFGIDGTDHRLAFTTDTYVVSPLFFAGGDIGKLAILGAGGAWSFEFGAHPLLTIVILELDVQPEGRRRKGQW